MSHKEIQEVVMALEKAGFVVTQKRRLDEHDKSYLDVRAWRTIHKTGWRVLFTVRKRRKYYTGGWGWEVGRYLIGPDRDPNADELLEDLLSDRDHANIKLQDGVYVLDRRQGHGYDGHTMCNTKTKAVQYMIDLAVDDWKTYVAGVRARLEKEATDARIAIGSLKRQIEENKSLLAAIEVDLKTLEPLKRGTVKGELLKCAACGAEYHPHDSINKRLCAACDELATRVRQQPGLVAKIEEITLTAG